MAGRDIELKLRIGGDGSVAIVQNEKVKGKIREVGEEAEKAGKRAREAFDENTLKGYLGMLDRVGSSLRNIAGIGVTIYVANKIREISSEAVQAQIQLDKMGNSLRFAAGGDQAAGARELDYVRQKAFQLGLQLNDTAGAYAKLAASAKGTRLEGAQTKEIFEAIAGAGTVMGLSVQEQSGALLAISQMMSKGTVQSEELRGQLGERLPGAFAIAARAMGVTTAQLSKMLEQGQVFSDEFLPKFAAQLKKELGDEVSKSANSAQAELNRLDSSYQNLKQQLAQTGAADVALQMMRNMRDSADEVAAALKRAREEGSGFWGQMGAGAAAGWAGGDWERNQSLSSLVNDPATRDRASRRLLQLQRGLLSMGTSIEDPDPQGYEMKREARALQQLLMAANTRLAGQSARDQYEAQQTYDDMAPVREEAAYKKSQELRLKLLAEYGDKKAKFEKEMAELELVKENLTAAEIAQIRAQLWQKIYGTDARQAAEQHYRDEIALEEGRQRRFTADLEAQRAAVKQALDQDLISQRQYYESVAELEQRELAARRDSVQRQLDQALAQKNGQGIEKFTAELEAMASKEQEITARKNTAIVKLEEKLRDDLLGIQAETYRKELSSVDVFVAQFQKRYAKAMTEALLDGNGEMVLALTKLFSVGMDRAQFDDAKRAFEEIFAQFKLGLEDLRQRAAETDGIVGMLQAAEASDDLRQKFLPALQAALDKLREMAGSNPELQRVVADLSRQTSRASGDSLEVWRGFMNEFVGLWREGASRAVEGGKPAFEQWIRDLRGRIAVGLAQYLAEIFARRYALNFVANMADSALGQGNGLSAAARLASGGDSYGSLLGNAAQWAGGLFGGAAGASGLIGSASAGAGTALAVEGSYGVGAGIAAEAGAVGIGEMAATAIPYIGWVIAAYMILSSLFDDGPENPTFRVNQGTGGRGAFGGLTFGGTMAGGDTSGIFRLIKDLDAGSMRVLDDDQERRVTASLARYTQAGLRNDGQPAEFAIPPGSEAAGQEQITTEILKSRYGAVFDEISASAAAAIRAFDGTSEELYKLIATFLNVEQMIQNAGGRLDWFAAIMGDFAGSSQEAQTAVGQVLGYLASDIEAMFEEAANGPRTVYGAWFRLGDQIRNWTDLSEQGVVRLGALTQQRYQAEIELVKQIQNAVEQTDDLFKGTIRDITLMTLDTPEKYDFIKGETDALMQRAGVTNDPELLMQMSQTVNANIRELFGLLDPATQRARLSEFTGYLTDASGVFQDRLETARRQVEDERNARLSESIASALEDKLKDFAEKAREAAKDFHDGASEINQAARTFRGGSSIHISFSRDGSWTVTEVGPGGGGGDSGGDGE